MVFLHRSIKGCLTKTKEMCYIVIVQSVLQYCTLIWEAYLKKYISNLVKYRLYNAELQDLWGTFFIEQVVLLKC